jgi:hypothetical protein
MSGNGAKNSNEIKMKLVERVIIQDGELCVIRAADCQRSARGSAVWVGA